MTQLRGVKVIQGMVDLSRLDPVSFEMSRCSHEEEFQMHAAEVAGMPQGGTCVSSEKYTLDWTSPGLCTQEGRAQANARGLDYYCNQTVGSGAALRPGSDG